MKKFFFSMMVCLFAVAQIHAQRSVSGKVTDDTGETLPGVNVVIKGSTTGATTDIDGNYRLQINDGDVLVFSFVGFQTQEIGVGTRSVIDVTMGGVTELQEVIVVAYGTKDKASYTGSASQVGREIIENRPISNVANALQGTVAGLRSTAASGQPGSSPQFQIRGVGTFANSTATNSINSTVGTSNPLIVLDGAVYDFGLNNLNPSDIESMTVLKDAASTALYGSRASNGVILVTTKRGSGKPKVNLRFQQGWTGQSIPDYEKMGISQYYETMWEGYRNELISGGMAAEAAATAASNDLIDINLGYNVFNVPNNSVVRTDGTINPNANLLYDDFDWFGALTRTGIRTDLGFDISGGNENSDYFVSVGYLKDDGYLIRSGFDRYTARLSVNNKLNSWLKSGVNLTGTYSESETTPATAASSNAFTNPFNFARFIGPIYPIFVYDQDTGQRVLDDEGNPIYDPGGISAERPVNAGRHVVQEQLLDDRSETQLVASTRAYLEAKFLENFTFKSNVGVDFLNNYESDFRNTIVGDGAPAGTSTREQENQIALTLTQTLNFDKTFDKHYVNALIGHESYSYTDRLVSTQRNGQIVAGNEEPDNFSTLGDGDGNVDKEKLESYISRVEYEYDSRFLVSASFRRDASSRFARDNRTGNFWSFGLGWRMDQESFLAQIPWINSLKLRGSYGEVGNNRGFGFYPYQGLYDIYNNALEPGLFPGNASNPALSWETTVQSDVAVDFTLFNGRLSGTFEYYDRTSKDLLFDVPLAPSLGVANDAVTRNLGSFKNTGIEIQLQGDLVKTNAFSWNLNVNISTVNNEIQTLPDGEEIDNGTKRLKEGGDFYEYYLRDYWGVNEANGDPLYRGVLQYDPSRDLVVGNDTLTPLSSNAREDFIGKSATPDFYGGITNTFTYKNFNLRVLMTYQIGGWAYDGAYAQMMDPGYGSAAHVDLANSWKQPGDVTDVPRFDPTNTTNIGAQSDRWLISATHLNLRQITLGYNLPSGILQTLKLSNVNVYVSGENLALFSKRKGLDLTRAFSGTTSNTYIPSRVFTLGLNVGF